MAAPRLFLIDGNGYIFRAYHAIPFLSNSKGLPTNAIYGFTTMLQKIVREQRPEHLAVAFDTKEKTFRHEAFEAYKANRPEMPDDLSVQLPYIFKTVEALRIPLLAQPGYEADDLIGTVASRAAASGFDITIVTGDKDFYQLVSPRIRLYDPMKDKVSTEAEVRVKFGVEPGQVIEAMMLTGDAIDNIPGVPGVGGKTAAALIAEFGTVENLLAHVDRVPKPKLREALLAHADRIRANRALVTIKTDCPVVFEPQVFRQAEPDGPALTRLFADLEFSKLLATPPASGGSGGAQPIRLRRTPETVAVLAAEGMDEVIVLTDLAVLQRLKPVLEDPAVKKYGHDLKTAALMLRLHGITLNGLAFDTMIAGYLINPNRRTHPFPDLCREYLGHESEPGPAQTTALFDLVEALRPLLENQGLARAFHEVEMPLIPVLTAMETAGFALDTAGLGALAKEVEQRLETMTRRIYQLAGGEFNLNSPKQLAEVLFEKLGLQPIKKTKTGYSTDEGVLHVLAVQHELPAELLTYRQLAKLKSTYLDALPRLVNPEDGRLHTSFHQTAAATGRLSSSDPNLQNIPVRSEWAGRVRAAFIAPAGHRLLSADYNQIELRLLAHFSQDPRLVEAFREDKDIHAETAIGLFRLQPGAITAEMRRVAKTVNFSVIYGVSPFGLSETLGRTQTEAKQYIDQYFAHYRAVRVYLDRTLAEAREKGYVTTLFGRRRPIPELQAKAAAARQAGERAAINTPLQGSAADLIKLAMIRVHHRLQETEAKARLLLQVHDELILEVPEAEIEAVRILVKTEMEGVYPLTVPLRVNIGAGPTWQAAHP